MHAGLRVGCMPRVHKSASSYSPTRLSPVRISAQPKEVFPGELAAVSRFSTALSGSSVAGMHAGLQHSMPLFNPRPRCVITGPQEERASAHDAFMNALQSAKPIKLRMPGMQQFAAAVSFVVRSIIPGPWLAEQATSTPQVPPVCRPDRSVPVPAMTVTCLALLRLPQLGCHDSVL
jgi:hypothetical protein